MDSLQHPVDSNQVLVISHWLIRDPCKLHFYVFLFVYNLPWWLKFPEALYLPSWLGYYNMWVPLTLGPDPVPNALSPTQLLVGRKLRQLETCSGKQ